MELPVSTERKNEFVARVVSHQLWTTTETSLKGDIHVILNFRSKGLIPIQDGTLIDALTVLMKMFRLTFLINIRNY